MKIKYRKINPKATLEIIKKGDWVDLKSYTAISLKVPTVNKNNEVDFNGAILSLGIAMQLPKGFEAIIVPRSSTFKNWKIIQTNNIGVIDNSYCGNNDEWKMPILAIDNTHIPSGSKVCQFRIQLSQKATILQKLRWFLSNKIEFIEVPALSNMDRGGFGTTGKN